MTNLEKVYTVWTNLEKTYAKKGGGKSRLDFLKQLLGYSAEDNSDNVEDLKVMMKKDFVENDDSIKKLQLVEAILKAAGLLVRLYADNKKVDTSDEDPSVLQKYCV